MQPKTLLLLLRWDTDVVRDWLSGLGRFKVERKGQQCKHRCNYRTCSRIAAVITCRYFLSDKGKHASTQVNCINWFI